MVRKLRQRRNRPNYRPRLEQLEDRRLLAAIAAASYTAFANETNNVKLTTDDQWLTYTEDTPNGLFFSPGAFNPDFLESITVTLTGDENNHATLVVTSGTVAGPMECAGPVEAPLGVGTLQCVGAIQGILTSSGLISLNPADPGTPSLDLDDATNQIDVEFSLISGLRALPQASAIVPIGPLAVSLLAAEIPAQLAAAYVLKLPDGAPPDLLNPAIMTGILTTLGLIGAAAASGDVTVDVGDEDDNVDLTAFGKNSTVLLGDGNDTLLMGLGNDNVQGGAGTDKFIHTLGASGTTKTIDGGAGRDILLINSFDNSDVVSMSFAGNTLTLTVNGQTNTYILSNVEEIALGTGGGDDDVVITNIEQFSGGLAIDLGDGFDRVEYASITTNILLSDYPFAVGAGAPWPGGGFGLLSLDNAITEFANIEELGLGGSGQTVNYFAPDSGNEIHVIGTGATTELRVDANATIVLKNNPTTLNLGGRSGDDTFVIDPKAGTSLTEINVTGGDFHNGDQLILNGRTVTDSLIYTPGADFASGQVTINTTAVNFSFIEAVKLYGAGGLDSLVVNEPIAGSNDTIYFSPELGNNGFFQFTTQSAGPETAVLYSTVSYQSVESLNFVTGTGSDTLSLTTNALPGTNSDGTIIGGAGAVTQVFLGDQVTQFTHDLAGDDTMALEYTTAIDAITVEPGPYVSISINTGVDSDLLAYIAQGGADVTVDLASQTISQTGFGDVVFTSIQHLDVQGSTPTVATNQLAVNGTALDDQFTHTSSTVSTAAGQLEFAGPAAPAPLLVTYQDFGSALIVDGKEGSDQLLYRGTSGADTFTVPAPLVVGPSIGLNSQVPVRTLAVEDYLLFGLSGNDTFNVAPVAFPVFVDGGDPIGTSAGDRLVVLASGSPALLEAGPERDEGGVVFGGVNERISYDHIEAITIDSPQCVLILGTNADDDITVIARDSSTHTGTDGRRDFTAVVNDGIEVLYTNVGGNAADPTIIGLLNIDAMAGDDDIVIRMPAPNQVDWSMDVKVAGGTPAATTGDQGDVLEVETPGTSPVIFSALDAGSATILVDTNGNGTFQAGDTRITTGQFFDACPPLNYDSSPGGVEQIIFQGLGGFPLTMNGGLGNDTATINADSTGTFRSLLSPAFDYSGAGAIIVNGGLGTDHVVYNGTNVNDVIDSQQVSATAVNTTVNGLTHTANGTEIIGINTLMGDDLIRIGVIDSLQTANPAASNRFDVDAGDANARLIVQDLGLGDLNIQRQGPDGRSGSITIGGFKPVVYKNMKRVDITPLNSITGGTGTDGNGRILIFPTDPFESNDSRLNAGQLARVGQNTTSPSIDPGAIASPFEVNGDEDWYEFRPQATGTFAVKILFDKIATLANGRAGLPGDGDLSLDIYDATGNLITSGVANAAGNSKTATFGATNDSANSQFNRIYVRVRGTTPNSINLYDFGNLDGVGTVDPGVGNADLFGPQVTNIQVNSVPSATYNLFNSKDAGNALHPTPLTNSLLISFRDLPQRAPGFIYPALDPVTATSPGTYVLRGDASGIIAISAIIIEPGTNLPPGVGGLAAAQVRLVFAEPLPDDRFTLTINDTLLDPAGNKLDGESNAAEPNGGPTLPSGDGEAGGNFVARFTIDTRVELGTFASGSVYVDTNGNYLFDPTNVDASHRDITYLMGFTSDNLFAGNFVKGAAGIADGFDKLAAYGKVGTSYRWLIDVNNDGVVNANDVTINQPLFAGVTNVNGTPVAGNFDGNAANGDEVALKVGNTWLLDKVGHDFKVDTKLPGTNMIGLPIVGDFDNDGVDDLGSWSADKFYLNLSSLGPIDGTADKIFTFGFASVRERPVAGDFDGDGITDLGLWVPDRAGVSPAEAAEWYLLLSGGTAVGRGGIAGQGQTILDRLNSPGGVVFTPAPFGNDLFAQFGDEYGLPIPGNFDPPITSAQPTGGFTNTQLELDVNNDGIVTAFDALEIINRLNSGNTALISTPFTHAPFVDVNGDGACSAMDALIVINWLNTRPTGSEATSAGEAVPADSVFAELGDDPGTDDTLLAILAADDSQKMHRSRGQTVGRTK
ncbi:dockerin type I domain-containing protein [Anatilimnocola sp. NA78]|uniref:dockerin type I domain-containing protein n=1 Tax=Anatilimnocola sp. NA78 TaxID=3415683 RepID=UPI003CE55678